MPLLSDVKPPSLLSSPQQVLEEEEARGRQRREEAQPLQGPEGEDRDRRGGHVEDQAVAEDVQQLLSRRGSSPRWRSAPSARSR